MNECSHSWVAMGKMHRCVRPKGHSGYHSTVPEETGMKSHYIIQKAHKSYCPNCKTNLDMLCHEWAGPQRERSFYICFNCKRVFEIGKGEVRREDE